MDRVVKGLVRLLAFFVKEINEVRRQPRLVLALILGPFLILLLFGIGYQGTPVRPRVALVIPDAVAQQFDTTAIKYAVNLTYDMQDVTNDENKAMAELAARQVDVVEVIPADAKAQVESGNSATVEFRYAEINQINETWIQSLAYGQVNEINKALLTNSTAQLQQEAKASQVWLDTASKQLDTATNSQNQAAVQGAQSGLAELQALVKTFSQASPGALVSPLQPMYKNVLGQTLSLSNYYAPAVLALILAHIAVTLGALSLVREKSQGAIELFRVAPVSIRQVLAGKYLAYLVFIGVIAAALALAMWAMQVPFRGSVEVAAGILCLLVLGSLGIGFLISTVSTSDTQAVQLSMLMLLLAIFFSGFFLPLENFVMPVRVIGYLLPITPAIAGLQDSMLRGILPPLWVWGLLAALALVTFLLVNLLAPRQLRLTQRKS